MPIWQAATLGTAITVVVLGLVIYYAFIRDNGYEDND